MHRPVGRGLCSSTMMLDARAVGAARIITSLRQLFHVSFFTGYCASRVPVWENLTTSVVRPAGRDSHGKVDLAVCSRPTGRPHRAVTVPNVSDPGFGKVFPISCQLSRLQRNKNDRVVSQGAWICREPYWLRQLISRKNRIRFIFVFSDQIAPRG